MYASFRFTFCSCGIHLMLMIVQLEQCVEFQEQGRVIFESIPSFHRGKEHKPC